MSPQQTAKSFTTLKPLLPPCRWIKLHLLPQRQRDFRSAILCAAGKRCVRCDWVRGAHAVCLNARDIDACRGQFLRQDAGSVVGQLLQRVGLAGVVCVRVN